LLTDIRTPGAFIYDANGAFSASRMKEMFYCMLPGGMIFLLLFVQGTLMAQEERGDLRFVFYNVENLFDPFSDSLTLDDEFTPGGSRNWTWARFLEKEQKICKVLASAGGWDPPELIGLCEVENRFVLNWLAGETPLLKYNYSIIHRDSPDERGIDVALLYLPSKFCPLEWKYIPVAGLTDPTRDVLYVRGLVMDRDTLHLVICHFPSRWEGYLESLPERTEAARTVRQLLDSLLHACNRPRILLAGDKNDELSDPGLESVLRVRMPGKSIRDSCIYHTGPAQGGFPGTLKYHGRWYEFDHIFVSGSFYKDSSLFVLPGGKTIHAPSFLLEKDPAVPGIRPFRTYNGYKYHGGFSDHLPVYIDIRRRE
jgi:hypothetical protein